MLLNLAGNSGIKEAARYTFTIWRPTTFPSKLKWHMLSSGRKTDAYHSNSFHAYLDIACPYPVDLERANFVGNFLQLSYQFMQALLSLARLNMRQVWLLTT